MDYQRLEKWREHNELRGLLDLSQPPKELWYCGTWKPEVITNCVAVVGSRRITEYGKRVLDKLIPPLVYEKKTIVSGFMYGVDQYAHNLAVDNGGKTIAVLGWGINQRLVSSDSRLAEKIIKAGGLMISEWESQRSLLWTFPVRNRIVAALSTDVYVIEAGIKSGSLITADWAVKLQRRLWAVPGPITSKISEGTNYLIASGKARMWTSEEKSQNANHKSQNRLITILENESLSADELARKMRKPVAEIGAQLSLLSLKGELKERGGKYYVD